MKSRYADASGQGGVTSGRQTVPGHGQCALPDR